ncbi:MAG: TatD family hydrolase [Oscillospiraceae bacterium]
MGQFSDPLKLKGIFDSHCHYDDGAFDDDREELLGRLMSDGSAVEFLMHACTDLESAQFGIKMSEKYPNYYTSVGIHPENITDDLPDDYIGILKRLCGENKKIRAIGEIGLDYHYDDAPERSVQTEVFTNQLKLAAELDLPVIMHCRDATEDFLSIMQEYKPKGVVHCFSGSAETAKQLLELGLYIGFTGVLSFKNAKKTKKAFAAVPADRLLFETDCPYMAPEPFRGKRCDSSMIAYVACAAEQLCEIDAQRLIDITNENAKRLFGIE